MRCLLPVFLNSHIEQPRYVFSYEEITWVEGQWSIVVLSVIIVMSCFLNQYTWYFHLYKNNILKNILITPHREKFLRKLYKNKYIKLYSLEKCKLYVNLHCKIKNECPRLPIHPANIIFIPRDNQITSQTALQCIASSPLKNVSTLAVVVWLSL